MKVLITGAAGFIGFHLSELLLKNGFTVVGIDNINDYYDVNLKYARLNELGVEKESSSVFYKECKSKSNLGFSFLRMNLEDKEHLSNLFSKERFDIVCNLAAQAGVRYSIENPDAYIQSNVVGFLNILECCRHNDIKHLVYASSSSVYGMNDKVPFSEDDQVDTPVSLYAATKKSNELMAHTYSHLYNIPMSGLRFFTVYGPWGRPDMAPFKFTKAIVQGDVIDVYNHGKMQRDFTYIDDIVEGVLRIQDVLPELNSELDSSAPYKIYNIGNSEPIELEEFISCIEKALNKNAIKNYMPMQPGDVVRTYADVSELEKKTHFKPQTSLQDGINSFVDWYKEFYS